MLERRSWRALLWLLILETTLELRCAQDVSPQKPSYARRISVTVVNDIPAHFEVLAGFLTVLQRTGVEPTTLFTGGPRLFLDVGMHSWMGLGPTEDALMDSHPDTGPFAYTVPNFGKFINVNPRASRKALDVLTAATDQQDVNKQHVVICISPELDMKACRATLARLKPAVFVMVVHRGDQITAKLRTMYPTQHLVALSPHVADACHAHTHMETDWTIPISPYHEHGKETCEERACLEGFVIQGAIREWTTTNQAGFTRDYARLWARLLQVKQETQRQQELPVSPRPTSTDTNTSTGIRVYVLGKGTTSKLGLPPELAEDVKHYAGLPYPEFWGRMHRSLALLPCFGTAVYFKQRLSSTILASLITNTPVVATPRLLKAYRFLSEEHVFLQHEGEDDVAAMQRILAMPEAEIFARRNALKHLRDQLNHRSMEMMFRWFGLALSQSQPPPSPQQTHSPGSVLLPGRRPIPSSMHSSSTDTSDVQGKPTDDEEEEDIEDYDDGVFVEMEGDAEGHASYEREELELDEQEQQDEDAMQKDQKAHKELQVSQQAEAGSEIGPQTWRRRGLRRRRRTRTFLTSVRPRHSRPGLLKT